ncbi:MAG: hypothetical protein IT179_01375 [Acidobacteria bacterium]|nr:hypothetical protein [Acidobacteriota bacterium]
MPQHGGAWTRALVIAALVPAWAGCQAPATPVARAAPAVTSRWHPLGTWSGRGNRQTESFDVTTGALRLRWEARGEAPASGGRLQVSLHSSVSGRPLQTLVDHVGAGAGTAYAADEPRVSYLVIESDQEWTATLDEAVPATTIPDR